MRSSAKAAHARYDSTQPGSSRRLPEAERYHLHSRGRGRNQRDHAERSRLRVASGVRDGDGGGNRRLVYAGTHLVLPRHNGGGPSDDLSAARSGNRVPENTREIAAAAGIPQAGLALVGTRTGAPDGRNAGTRVL